MRESTTFSITIWNFHHRKNNFIIFIAISSLVEIDNFIAFEVAFIHRKCCLMWFKIKDLNYNINIFLCIHYKPKVWDCHLELIITKFHKFKINKTKRICQKISNCSKTCFWMRNSQSKYQDKNHRIKNNLEKHAWNQSLFDKKTINILWPA